jgi:hypothetical protein
MHVNHALDSIICKIFMFISGFEFIIFPEIYPLVVISYISIDWTIELYVQVPINHRRGDKDSLAACPTIQSCMLRHGKETFISLRQWEKDRI